MRRIWRVVAVVAGAALALPIMLTSAAMASPTAPGAALKIVDGCTIVSSPTPTSFTDCSGDYMLGANLTGLNLSYANFYNTYIPQAKLSHTNFYKADLSGTVIGESNLTGASLRYADLAESEIASANLNGAVLSGAVLTKIVSGFIVGTPASLPSNWELIDGYLVGPHDYLKDASLPGTDLSGLQLEYTNLVYANLSNANLSDANLTHVKFSTANLTGANLAGAVLTRAIWSDTTCPDGTNSNNDGDTCVNDLG